MKEKDVLYERHCIMRVSINCWTPHTDPSRTVMGISEEEDPKVLWIASTNSTDVSAALYAYVSVTRGLDISFSEPSPEQATRFSVHYDRRLWSSIDVRNALLTVITDVNVQPRQTRGPQLAEHADA